MAGSLSATRRRPVRWPAVLAAGIVAFAALAVPAMGSAAAGAATKKAAKRAHGPVDVLYAGSLVGLMRQGVGPAFDATTGYTFNGFAGGSQGLASEIRGKTQLADVFISASPTVDTSLEGPANGKWVSWYATFARSPLLIGYNPDSSFASALRSKPWYDVVTQPGFILGRTDPATDPKGVLAVDALHAASKQHHIPALAALASGTSGEYPEQSLVGLLEAGQVDAGFFYGSEASAAGIPTVSLGNIHYSGAYTVTVVNRAPDEKAADAFVKFLFSKLGRTILDHDGLTLLAKPKLSGSAPKDLKAVLAPR